MEDSQIIALFFARSEQALRALQDKYGGLCRSVVSNILPDMRDVDECISDTYLRIWRSIPPQHPQRLDSYIARVARNAALDRHDYNRASIRNSSLTLAYEELEYVLPSHDGGVDAVAFRTFLNQFLRSQKKDARIMFIRRYWYGDSIQQIAGAFGCGEEKVKSVLFRIRNKLREAMIKEGIYL
jgi:RNA polymerase sigma-70 factor (ECF subfamily)